MFITPPAEKNPVSGKVSLAEIRKAIIETAELFSIPVYDNYKLSGVDVTNLNIYTSDGTHWTDATHEMIGKNIAKWMLATVGKTRETSGASAGTGTKVAVRKERVSQFENDSGYATKTYVQNQIGLIPEKLPNPNALTFTGAVTGSYDGSAPLEVAIPSGGGSSDSVVFANDILAEGTVSSGLAAWSAVDTGVAPQELRAYKSFAIYYFGMTGRTYAILCGKSLGQLTNILLFEWEDSAKTILRLISADNGKTNLFHKDYREELTNPTYQSPLCPIRTDFRNATDDNLKLITSKGTTTEATDEIVGRMK